MSREVFGLLGTNGLAPSMPTNNFSSGTVPIASNNAILMNQMGLASPGVLKASVFKNKRSTVNTSMKGKWIWKGIYNSARTHDKKVSISQSQDEMDVDCLTKDENLSKIPIFFHWERADLHISDYPYAKFDTKLADKISYTDEEYEKFYKDPEWSRKDTDKLIEVSEQYDLRWPVIFDRIKFPSSTDRPLEAMQCRYYTILLKMKTIRNPNDSNVLALKNSIDLIGGQEMEKNRRRKQDTLFRRLGIIHLFYI